MANLPRQAGESAPDGATFRGWYTVWLLAFVSVLAQVDRGVLSLLVQPIKRDLHLSDTNVSLLIGFAFTFFYVVVGPPMSRVTDWAPRKRVIAVGLTVWSLATALCGIVQGFWGLFFSRALVGAGESVNGPASYSIIADCVPRDRLPRAYAILNGGVAAGMALSMVIGGVLLGLLAKMKPIAMPGLGVIHYWQIVFLAVGLPGLVIAALTILTVPEPARRGGTRPGGYPLREVFGLIVSQRGIHVPLVLAMMLWSIASYGVSGWLPAFYERTYGWGPARTGPLLGGSMLITSFTGLWLGTKLAEYLGPRHDDANLRTLMLAQLFALPFGIAAPLMPSPWLALGCSAIMSLFAVMGGPSYNAAIQLATPNEMRGQVNAMYLFTISAIGGAVGPTLVAFITDHFASEHQLRYVLTGVRVVLGPIPIVLIWLAMKPYARVYRQRVDAGEWS